MAKKTIDKLHEIIGGEKGDLGDGSASYISLKNAEYTFEFSFDGKGKKLLDISVWKRKWIEDVSTKVTKVNI